MWTHNYNKRQNGSITEQSASCTRIKEKRPCPPGIRKRFIDEVAFELSWEDRILMCLGKVGGEEMLRD